MEIKEISDALTQVVAVEIQGKEEGVLYEKDSEPMPPLTTIKEGSIYIELVGDRVAEPMPPLTTIKESSLDIELVGNRVAEPMPPLITIKEGSLDIELVGNRVADRNRVAEPMPPLIMIKEGSLDIELVGNRVADSEKDTSFSGNSGEGVSQSAAGRGEDLSDENAATNQDISAFQKQMFNQIDQMRAVQNDTRVLYSGTDTNLNFSNIGVHMPEVHLNLGMDLNVSSVHSIRTEEDHDQRRREKRKQSNRESAKRSRFRRQHECEKLRETAEMLKSEISELPNELRRLSEECGKLDEENNYLVDEMEKMYGPDAVADLRAVKVNSSDDGSNSIELNIPRDSSTSPTPSHRMETSPTPPHPKETSPTHKKEASPTPEPRLFGVTLRPADCLRS